MVTVTGRKACKDTEEVAQDDPTLTYEDLSITHSLNAEHRQAFVDFCQNDVRTIHEKQCEDIEEKIESNEDDLRDCGDKIRQLQAQLQNNRLKLQKLQQVSVVEPDADELEASWQEIKNIRGIREIYCCYSNNEEHTYEMHVTVNVRIAYQGQNYDVGDYDICITHLNFVCKCLRTGVRDDWMKYHSGSYASRYPDYRYNDNTFCFGNRDTEIYDYFNQRRFREMIILIVDCLHSVNNRAQAECIPQCFRKVVPPREEG